MMRNNIKGRSIKMEISKKLKKGWIRVQITDSKEYQEDKRCGYNEQIIDAVKNTDMEKLNYYLLRSGKGDINDLDLFTMLLS